ncbi:hypothetical protein CSC43_7001 [Pseudomonas aeruginosa]|nr:hypothetical protein CSC43_7001 [Pseudomonas aeruginosa]
MKQVEEQPASVSAAARAVRVANERLTIVTSGLWGAIEANGIE